MLRSDSASPRARRSRPRPRFSLVGWYLLVSLLHALWDAAGGIAVWLTLVLTGTQAQWTFIRLDEVPGATQGHVHLYTALTWGLMGLDAVLGVLILVLRRRRAIVAPTVTADIPGRPSGANRGDPVTATLIAPSPRPGRPGRGQAPGIGQAAGFMALLDVSIGTVALPSIERGLAASAGPVQRVVSGYPLTMGLVPVPAGRLGDSFGWRRTFLIALCAVVVTSTLTGMAPLHGGLGGLVSVRLQRSAPSPSACHARTATSPLRPSAASKVAPQTRCKPSREGVLQCFPESSPSPSLQAPWSSR